MMPRWTRWIAPGALLLALALLGMTWALRPAREPQIGRPFPRLALAPLVGHPPLTDVGLRGGAVTLVNFFASWCVPCRAEAPQLIALRARGVAVAGIAVRDVPADTQRFLDTSGVRFAQVGLDPRGTVQAALGASGIPETYVVDGGGIIRARFRGDLHAADLNRVLNAVAAAR